MVFGYYFVVSLTSKMGQKKWRARDKLKIFSVIRAVRDVEMGLTQASKVL
jgi:hypothetical protein